MITVPGGRAQGTPFARYFTDPFVLPPARWLRIHQLVSVLLLFLVAAA